MPQLNVTGIVLRCFDLGEKDRIIVLLTPERGKMRVVAKGAKRPGGRFAAAASPLMVISASINLGRNLHTLNQVQITTSHRALRERLDRLSIALFMLELVEHSTLDEAEQPEFYHLLEQSLQDLTESHQPELTLCFFLVQLLTLTGLAPIQDYCATCQAHERPLVALSPAAGGLVCAQCATAPGVFPLPPAAVELLGYLTDPPGGDYSLPRDLSRSALLALCRALEQFVFYQLEVRPKSYDFLLTIRGTN